MRSGNVGFAIVVGTPVLVSCGLELVNRLRFPEGPFQVVPGTLARLVVSESLLYWYVTTSDAPSSDVGGSLTEIVWLAAAIIQLGWGALSSAAILRASLR
jgi:hypothetical protein